MTPRPTLRRGWSLIEMVVVVSAMTVMLGLAGGLIFRMIGLDRSERARVVASSSLERLARALRLDARAATGPADVAEGRLVLPMADGRSAEYVVRAGDVLRTVRLGGKAEHFETYRRPRGTLARFESDRDGARPVVALVLDPDPKAAPERPGDPSYRGYRIEAVPGLDARLTPEVPR